MPAAVTDFSLSCMRSVSTAELVTMSGARIANFAAGPADEVAVFQSFGKAVARVLNRAQTFSTSASTFKKVQEGLNFASTLFRLFCCSRKY